MEPKWCIMVYLAGGRDASGEARESLMRMKEVGSTDNINVIAQFDSGSEGTFTKRYHLKLFQNAIGIETLLRQACFELPATFSPKNSTVSSYFYQRLMDILPQQLREKFQRTHQSAEMIELLKCHPYRFKNLLLDYILDEDLHKPDGNLGDTNAGDPRVLIEFVQWGKREYPAEHTMVIVWGHGSGLSVAWDFPASPFVQQGDSLAAKELSKAFLEAENGKSSHKVDIVGFNSCSLGTIEVYRQLKGLVHFGIASEGFTPKTSWPYDRILRALNKALDNEPNTAPEKVAQIIVDQYIAYYAGSVRVTEQRQLAQRKLGVRTLGTGLDLNKGPDLNIDKGPNLNIDKGPDLGIDKGPDLGLLGGLERRGIDLSVCDLDESWNVAKNVKALVKLLQDRLKESNRSCFSAILAAHAISQSYFNKDFTDLDDFCRTLSIFSKDQEIQKTCGEVRQAVNAMCKRVDSVGKDVQNSKGVSIYFPWDDWEENDSRYSAKNFEFLEQTKWHEFLRMYRNLVDDLENTTGEFKEKPLAAQHARP